MSSLRRQNDGIDKIAEVGAATPIVVQRRYVFGPGVDEPLVMYEGADTTKKDWLVADERGSVVAVTGDAGFSATNTYDEYGRPGPGSFGLFQYTGQAYIAATGLYDYKARVYDPGLGRFLQADPIGYRDGMNLYAYVGGDPVNLTDPFGLSQNQDCKANNCAVDDDLIVVTGQRKRPRDDRVQARDDRVQAPRDLFPRPQPDGGRDGGRDGPPRSNPPPVERDGEDKTLPPPPNQEFNPCVSASQKLAFGAALLGVEKIGKGLDQARPLQVKFGVSSPFALILGSYLVGTGYLFGLADDCF